MFSLQNFIARDGRVFDLLEESAEQGRASIQSAIEFVRNPQSTLEPCIQARRRDKQVTNQIREHLVTRFVLPLDREDIHALSNALYKIPKTVEKFSERYLISGNLTQGMDLSHHLAMMDRAGELVVSMVRSLRADLKVATAKAENEELQRIEGDADKLMLQCFRGIFDRDASPLRSIVIKDLYELLERTFDRCRDAGNIVYGVALKYS